MSNAAITTPNARKKLKAQGRPHYRLIHKGLHLGYRKSKGSGRWVMRLYLGGGEYKHKTIATADDGVEANGHDVLSFAQAQERIRETANEVLADTDGRVYGPLTVRKALDEYFREHLGREGRDSREARRRLNTIAEALGDIEVKKLTRRHINKWMLDMAKRPPMLRGGKPMEVDMSDPDVQRRRRDSANRHMNDLKAALNFAVQEGRAESGSWRDAKPFTLAGDNRPRYLSMEEVRRLLNAADPDLRALIQGGLMTGARRGDLVHMRVKDYMRDAGAVMVGNRKVRYKGKPPFPCYLSDEGVAFFEAQTAGRDPEEPMFTRNGNAWREDDVARPMREANKRASINPPASINVLRHTYASHAVMAGTTLMAVAQNLGHSDTRMVENHYAHLAPNWRKEQAKLSPSFGLDIDNKVEAIR